MEKDEQADVVSYLEGKGFDLWATFNEQGRGGAYSMAALRRKMGGRKGAPDLTLVDLTPSGKPTVIEMKSLSGELSGDQVRMHKALRRKGWNVVVGYGAKDALRKLQKLGYDVSVGDLCGEAP